MKTKYFLFIISLSLGLSTLALAKPVTGDKIMEMVTPSDGSGVYYRCTNPGSNCSS